MPTAFARIILAIVTIASLFPMAAMVGLFFSFALVGGELFQAANGAPLRGGIGALVFIFAFCGVFVLCNLVLHCSGWQTSCVVNHTPNMTINLAPFGRPVTSTLTI